MTNQIQLYRRFYATREKKYTVKIHKALKEQYQMFIDGRTVDQEPIRKVLSELYWESFRIWAKKMNAMFRRAEQQKADGSMGISQALIDAYHAYFGVDILNTSQNITETTRKIIAEILANSLERRLTLPDIVREISEKSEMSKARAELIARTETTTAANAAAYYAALNSRLVMQKRWISAIDKRTRKDHKEMNNTLIDIEEPFKVGGYEMRFPGDKGGTDGLLPVGPEQLCNCRCAAGYVPKRQENGLVMLKPRK